MQGHLTVKSILYLTKKKCHVKSIVVNIFYIHKYLPVLNTIKGTKIKLNSKSYKRNFKKSFKKSIKMVQKQMMKLDAFFFF